VNRIGATNLKLSVDYATQAAPANPATAGNDYAPITPPRTLTFNVGEVSKTIQVAIPDDPNSEGPENVDLVLSNPKNLTAGAAPQIGPSGPAGLTINDDDVSTFKFSASAYSVHEDDSSGHATITVDRTGATNLPASVNYSTSNGTRRQARTTQPRPGRSTSPPARPRRHSPSTSPTTAPQRRTRR
jgi:Calx-beta domain